MNKLNDYMIARSKEIEESYLESGSSEAKAKSSAFNWLCGFIECMELYEDCIKELKEEQKDSE